MRRALPPKPPAAERATEPERTDPAGRRVATPRAQQPTPEPSDAPAPEQTRPFSYRPGER